MHDPVKGPSHYRGRSGRQSIEVTHAYRLGPDLTQAVDYILRAGRKTPDPRQDLAKAAFYLRYAARVPACDRVFGTAYPAAPGVAEIVTDFGITCRHRAMALAVVLGVFPSAPELEAAAQAVDDAIAAWTRQSAGEVMA